MELHGSHQVLVRMARFWAFQTYAVHPLGATDLLSRPNRSRHLARLVYLATYLRRHCLLKTAPSLGDCCDLASPGYPAGVELFDAKAT